MLMALPSGLMVVFSVLFVKIFGASFGFSELETDTLLYYLLGSIGFLSVARACIPLNLWRIGLILWSLVGFFGTAHFLKKLLEIGSLTAQTFPLYLILMAVFTLIFLLTNTKTFTQKLKNL